MLRQDTALLTNTREQASSAALLASTLANSEQDRVLSRALDAVAEPVDLPTQVYLIGRLFAHIAQVYGNSSGARKMQLLHMGPPARQVYQERSEFMYQVSHLLHAA